MLLKKLLALGTCLIVALLMQVNAYAKDTDKVLVVYYSATGTTEKVANIIAKETNGTLFKIEPKVPYSLADLDHSDDNSRVSKEHDDESLRNVELKSVTVPNFKEYNVVFVGYPIWWGIAAWPINTFVKANDFTGKRIIPFATSHASSLGQSGFILAKLAGTGTWDVGMRFSSSVDESKVKEWLAFLK